MASRISRKLWRRGRPSFCGTGKSASMHSHSVSARSVGYALLMHARVPVPTPVYPFFRQFHDGVLGSSSREIASWYIRSTPSGDMLHLLHKKGRRSDLLLPPPY